MADRASSVTLDLVGAERGALQLAPEQVVAGDGHLLVLGVAVEADDLHPVEQRPGDGVDHVGGGDEQHLGQVELHLEVVVAEGVVLCRIEHLEQRRGRVAPVVGSQLVDLVEHDDRVHGAGLAEGAHQPAGLGAHVGAAVPSDLGLVADAAQGHPDERPSEGPGHRLAQRGLAHARRDRPGPGWHPRRGRRPGPGRARPASLRTARCSRMRSFTSRRPSWSSSRMRDASATSSRSSDSSPHGSSSDGVQPGSDPPVLGVLLARPLELVDLAVDRLAHRLGQVSPLEPGSGSRRARPRRRSRAGPAPCGWTSS